MLSESFNTAADIYLAQYAGQGEAAIYSGCSGSILAALLIIGIVGLLIIGNIL
jgi:arginine utilization protein RocB